MAPLWHWWWSVWVDWIQLFVQIILYVQFTHCFMLFYYAYFQLNWTQQLPISEVFFYCFFIFLYLYLSFFLIVSCHIGELERRIGAIPWRIWVKKQGANHLKSYWTKKHSKLSESQKREKPPKLRTFLQFCNWQFTYFHCFQIL